MQIVHFKTHLSIFDTFVSRFLMVAFYNFPKKKEYYFLRGVELVFTKKLKLLVFIRV